MPEKNLNALHVFADMIDRCDDLVTLLLVISTIHAMTDTLLDQITSILNEEKKGRNNES